MAYKWATISIYHLEDDGLNSKKLVVDREKIIVDEQRDHWNEIFSYGDEEKYQYYEIITGIRFTNKPINEIRLEYYLLDKIPGMAPKHAEAKMKFDVELLGSAIKMNAYDNKRPLPDVSLDEIKDYYENFQNTKFFKSV